MLRRKQLTKKENQLETTKDAHGFPIEIFLDVQKNIENIQKILNTPSDLVTREFTVGNTKQRCAIVCIDGLVDQTTINDKIIRNIQLGMANSGKEIPASGEELLKEFENHVLSAIEVKKLNTLDQVMQSVLSGDTALFVQGTDQVLLIGSKGWASRGVNEPSTEALVRGPRDGFTENLRTNTAHIRRHIRDPNLRFENFSVGRRSKKDLVLTYIDGIVHPDLVGEVKRRIKTIDLDDAPESGFIEQWLEDSFLSPFPTLSPTERPDKVCAALTQGKVGLLLDGTPFALVAPITFGNLLQSPEDYYERWWVGTFLRFLRYFGAFLAVFLPGLYIALVSYHPGMIPSKLAFSIAAAREGVPFPAVIEALVMITVLELLREAGIRLPKPIGQTIGIVGGLVIGEAAVSAGIVSPVMVIVVALTAISSFSVPSYSLAITFRILVYGMMFLAAGFGLFGLILGYIMINIHLVNLKSFGIPYSTPFAPSFYADWKDLILRAPIMMIGKRPIMMQVDDEKRMRKGGKS
nr:spore germination protein [Ammoniphilus resinae]